MSDNVKKAKKQASETVDGVMDYIGDAFDTGMNAAKGIHQAGVEIPLNILQSLGLPEDNINSLKVKHGELLDAVYDSVQSVISEVGKAGAGQINLLKKVVLEEKSSKPKGKAKPKAAPRRKTSARAKAGARTKARR